MGIEYTTTALLAGYASVRGYASTPATAALEAWEAWGRPVDNARGWAVRVSWWGAGRVARGLVFRVSRTGRVEALGVAGG